ncbi:thiosulfate oxidation carrier protein SoxY [Caldovatus aquaticus]|uniref:Ig-like SoxY domain-containing protein n=1 Tax=Caldovatus aquaticus TaxID=2865671 RepID=A0ABS7F4S2_9PROT|nr:thiosulfate oxidation carrier protein SoxY [Caldovatus aquaticus]MBW8270298.1 hypothetical protein [Caldovatus aquaticus]
MRTMAGRSRHLLAAAAGGAAIAVLPKAADAQMRPAAAKAIRRAIGERTPREGRVTLRLRPIAESGNAMPPSVSVESPMTAADHVKRVFVFADKNPTPEVAKGA